MTGRDVPGGASVRSPARPEERRRVKIGGAGTALLGVLVCQGFLASQERDCKLVKVGGYTDSRRQDSVNYAHRASGGIDYRCTDGTRIVSDSAVVWERSGNAFFFGNVHYEDPDTELEADSARYFDNTRELVAYSNVTLTDRKGGAVVRGQVLNYLTESRFRRVDRILITGGSPRAVVHPARRPAAPVAGAGAGEEGAGEEDDPAVDSPTDEVENPEGDSVPGEVVGDPAADSLAGRVEGPAMDSVPGQPAETPAADSLAGEVEVGVGDSVPDQAEDPAVDSPGDASPESEEGEAAPSAEAPVDSVTPPPYEVSAPRIMIDGRRHFRAGGGVEVTRDSLRAVGDSLDYDQEVGAMLILGDASVEDSGFLLKGLSVSVTPTAGLDEEILAREEAELTGDEVLMTAPAIRLFLEDGQVDRLVALPTVPPFTGDGGAGGADTTGLTPGDAARVLEMAAAAAAAAAAADSLNAPDSLARPSVVAAEFHLTGDSIEVLSPGQVLDVVTAVGAARAEAMDQDTLVGRDLPEIARRDWMEGETIVAQFVSAAPGEDTATAGGPPTAGARARLETLTAIVAARSLYRLYDTDTTAVEGDTTGAEPGADPDSTRPDVPVATADSAPAPEAPAAAADSTTNLGDPDPALQEEDPAAEECDTVWADGEAPPGLHYVSGNEITIFLEGSKVVKMEVTGRTQGYHLDPLPPDCGTAAADTAAAADTVAVDTVATPPDTATGTTTRPPPTPPHPGRHVRGHALPESATRERPSRRKRAARPRRGAALHRSHGRGTPA